MTSNNETTGVTKLRGSFVTLHALDTAGLQGREEVLHPLVAPHFVASSLPERPRLEKLGAGLLLRNVLGVTRDNQLCVGEHGKLFLAKDGSAFNISDDNGLVVLGVANRGTGPIGVDVNEVPDVLNRPKLSVARKYFSPAEAKAVGAGQNYEERVAFARAWGNIEAPLKAMGTGFTFDVMQHREVLDGWPTTSTEIEVASRSAAATSRHFIAVVAASIKPQVAVVFHNANELLGSLS